MVIATTLAEKGPGRRRISDSGHCVVLISPFRVLSSAYMKVCRLGSPDGPYPLACGTVEPVCRFGESSLERLSSGRHTSSRPGRSRAHAKARINRLPLSLRVVTALGFVAALLGIAIGLGAVRMPLAARATKAPRAAASVPSQSGVNSEVFAHPSVRFSPLASPSPTPTRTPSAVTSPAAKPRVRQSPVPTTAPSSPHASASPVLVPTPTAEYQTPRGANELAWSEAILRAFGDPLTSANIVSMGYWMQNEAGHPPYGIVGANNPINVSEPGYGGTPIQNEGGGYFLYSYPTVKNGIEAIVAYLNRPNYVGILAALKEGIGLSSPSLASEFSVYSGNGYSTVPDSWGASQGKPET